MSAATSFDSSPDVLDAILARAAETVHVPNESPLDGGTMLSTLPRVISAPGLEEEFLVIPLGKTRQVVHETADPTDGVLVTQLMNQLEVSQQACRQAEHERDALTDRVTQDFEELHWLRALATTLAASDATTDLTSVADAILPELRQLIRADVVAFVPFADSIPKGAHAQAVNRVDDIVWHGETQFERAICLDLVRQFQGLPDHRPVVFNRYSHLRTAELETPARNVLALSLIQGGRQYGWLLALNRAETANDACRGGMDQESPEFGSQEAGLMAIAAGMLAGQARNVELFQAEENLRLGIIETVTGAIDARDPYTCGHSRRVAERAREIGARLGYRPDQLQNLYITGLMHDVGKIGIPDHILKKAGRLTDDEFRIIQKHPTIGHTILLPLQRLAFVLPGVLHHHERFDGRGYPYGLAGDAIPMDAQILAVADSYDAMTSDRAYRSGMPREKARAILREGAGTQWNPDAVAAFLEISDPGV